MVTQNVLVNIQNGQEQKSILILRHEALLKIVLEDLSRGTTYANVELNKFCSNDITIYI